MWGLGLGPGLGLGLGEGGWLGHGLGLDLGLLGLLGLLLHLRRHHLRNQRLGRLTLQKTKERSSGSLGNRSSGVLAAF